MRAGQEMLQRHRLNVDRNPLAEEPTTGGPPKQGQDRPGSDAAMRPQDVFLASTDRRYYTGEVFAPTGFQTISR